MPRLKILDNVKGYCLKPAWSELDDAYSVVSEVSRHFGLRTLRSHDISAPSD